jgi:hypothetical protein
MAPKVSKPATGTEQAPPVRTCTQFTDIEVGELLNIISAKKPIGKEMWKEVENEWNALAATQEGFTQQPSLSLKQKFTRLCYFKTQTQTEST